MNNEYYGAPTTSTEDFLAHYGIRGMKWGVRKAINRVSGSARDAALSKQYNKAAKKLAKLEKQAANSKKYTKRAIAYGAGAAAAGGLAAAGTKGVGRLVRGAGTAMQEAGYGASRLAGKYIKNGKVRNAIKTAGAAVGGAGTAVKGTQTSINKWGNANTLANKAANAYGSAAGKYASYATKGNEYAQKMASDVARGKASRAIGGISNNTIARAGAGLVGVGLGAAAARNAYKARTAEKRAAKFRSEMNKAFAGTRYANGGGGASSSKKRKGNRRG